PAKPLPGHGSTAQDPHLARPTVGHPRDRLEAIEFPPFREAIGAGVAAVMTAHVVYPALDPDHPATLSPAIIGMLRGEMGFAGIVVSDSMRMRAIADLLGPGEAAVQAVLAGGDLVLALGPTEVQWGAPRAARAAAAGGRIPPARLRAAAERVVAGRAHRPPSRGFGSGGPGDARTDPGSDGRRAQARADGCGRDRGPLRARARASGMCRPRRLWSRSVHAPGRGRRPLRRDPPRR